MSSYKCELCCLPYKFNCENVIDKYQCNCGYKVCDKCITHITVEQIKCNLCMNIPTKVLDSDYDCVCEKCGDYNGDGFGIELDERGLECYMCSCCKNGCYKKNETDDCRCWKILLDDEDNTDNTDNTDNCD